MSTLVAVVAVLDAAEVQGVDLPSWVYLIGAVLSPVVVYLKPENRPSSSARQAINS